MTIEKSNRSILNLNSLILLQIGIFVTIRIFVDFDTFFIQWDEGKYLTLARNFPFHRLYNHSLYLVHPPLYPYFIRFFSLFFTDYLAGIILSFLSICGFIILFYKLMDFMKLHKKELFFSIFLVTFNWITYYYSHMIYKEVFYLFLITGAIYFFIRGVSSNSSGRLIASAVFASASAFTADQALLLPLILLAGYIVYAKKGLKDIKPILPILICVLSSIAWILIKYKVFASNNYYPAGVDGIIENLNAVKIKQIIFPWFLPNTQKILSFGGFSTSIKHYISEIGVLINIIWPAHMSQSLHKTHKILFLCFVYVPLFTALISGIILSFIRAMKRRCIANNTDLFMLILLFISLLPLTNKMGAARYAIIAIVPVYYFIIKGFGYMISKTKLTIRNSTILILIILELVIFIPLWISQNPHIIFNLKKEVQCQKTSDFLSGLKGDGIMAEFGYPPEIAYLTDKRVMCLPYEPAELGKFIKELNINYLVCAITYEGIQNGAATDIGNYIAKSNKYIKIKAIDDTYSSVQWRDKITIYKTSSDI
ncbi:MAG: glycosyltransferase family 39 protein [bacterium]|nr:glycosyltransferase family 39 protein [bacterium]